MAQREEREKERQKRLAAIDERNKEEQKKRVGDLETKEVIIIQFIFRASIPME